METLLGWLGQFDKLTYVSLSLGDSIVWKPDWFGFENIDFFGLPLAGRLNRMETPP